MQQKDCSQHVRIHHPILDAQKHILHTLVKEALTQKNDINK